MATNSNTVKFNVGGKHFEVSRDLINKHSETMLGKLVSDSWQEDPEEPVFIDRNGDTFAYVLDYLRYGSIELPFTVSQTMFDRDLDYYGINAEKGAITCESIGQTVYSMRQAKIKHDMFFLAFEAHHQFQIKNCGNVSCIQVDIRQGHTLWDGRDLSVNEKLLFTKYLNTHFGLKLFTNNQPTRNGKFHVMYEE